MKSWFKNLILPLLIAGIILVSISIALLYIGEKKEKLYIEKIDLFDVESEIRDSVETALQENTVQIFEGKDCKYLLISYGYVSGVDFKTSFEVDGMSFFANIERVEDKSIVPTVATFRIYKTNAKDISFDDSTVKNPYYTMLSDSGVNRGLILSSTKKDSLSTISIQPTEDDTLPHTIYEIPTDLYETIDSSLVSFEYEYKDGYNYPRITKVNNEKELIQLLKVDSIDKNNSQITLELKHGGKITISYNKNYLDYFSSLKSDAFTNLKIINKNGSAVLNPFLTD